MRRITSGELLKYRKGLCIAGGYGTPVSGSSQFGLTLPWDGTRESARAAFDALPFLKQAEAVHVLTIDPGEQLEDNPLSPGEGLALSLARHDVSVEAHTSMTNGEISVAEELLSRASDHGCDLLVMGCYGHSRLRETLFGGTTRAILKSMTVPVLLSH